jgi:hypothetical protein
MTAGFGAESLQRAPGRLKHYQIHWNRIQVVMAGLDPAIYMDPRVKPGDDEIG